MKKLISALISLASILIIPFAKAGTMGPIEQPCCWTGFYLGGNLGYGWNHRSTRLFVPHDPGSRAFYLPAIQASAMSTYIGYNQKGFIGGGQLGYNYQIERAVVGIEVDFDGADIKGTSRVRRANLGTGFTPWLGLAEGKLKWLGTIRGRVGMTFVPQALLYLTGGYAYGEVEHRYQSIFALSNDFFTSKRSKNKSGYSIGLGSEWAFNCHLSARVEYLYFDLGRTRDQTIPGGRDVGLVALGSIKTLANAFPNSGNLIRAGVNYRFG